MQSRHNDYQFSCRKLRTIDKSAIQEAFKSIAISIVFILFLLSDANHVNIFYMSVAPATNNIAITERTMNICSEILYSLQSA